MQASTQRVDSESRQLFTIQSQVAIAAVTLSALRYVFSSSPLVSCRCTADLLGFFELSTFVASDVALISFRVDEVSFCSLTHMNPHQTRSNANTSMGRYRIRQKNRCSDVAGSA